MKGHVVTVFAALCAAAGAASCSGVLPGCAPAAPANEVGRMNISETRRCVVIMALLHAASR